MATHDYDIANQSGAAFRTDLNNALAAIQSNNSNSSSPATTVAYQWWADTNAAILKLRNSSNNAWLNIFTLAGGVAANADSNFQADVTFTTNNGNNIVFDKSDNRFLFNDNTNATFGTGADLKIFHDGTDSFIDNATGGLKILGDTIRLKGKTADENMVVATVNDAAELYFDSSKKFETWTSGARLPSDNNVLALGAGDDLRLWHNATNSIIRNLTGQLQIQSDDLRLGNYNFTETYVKALENGAVELYHDNVKSIETTATGCTIQKDGSNINAQLFIKSTNGGQAQLQLEAGGNQGGGVSRAARIDFVNTEVGTTPLWTLINDYQQNGTNDFGIRHGAELAINANPDGAVKLYFDNSDKLETFSEGITTRETVRMKHGTIISNRKQVVFQAISAGTSHTFTTTNGHGGGFVTVVGILNGNSTFATTTVFPFALRSTANAGVGSSILSVGGAQGGFNYQVSGASKGITVTNTHGSDGNFYVTFDITGSVA